ncbi:hypothetical protein L1987_03687 [Smallanthus sonchifolius]|uniref:Uncharacterized protein n=1 Tax=Smallanthus sonchifolius TaxID=185202 RepID=A0ACB9KB72_9ASTR|nr:hypothetical protein L1987_03687 [Smallanthus sonchifolius]
MMKGLEIQKVVTESPSPDLHINVHNESSKEAHDRVPTPPPQSSADISRWRFDLKAQNESLHKVVNGLTTLVTSLNTIIVSQAKEIKNLKKLNFKLSHAETKAAKVKSFKRKGERVYDDDNGGDDVADDDDADYGHFSPVYVQEALEKEVPENELTEVLVVKDKRKDIERNKKLKDEYTRRNLLEMQTAAILATKGKYEKELPSKGATMLVNNLTEGLKEREKVEKGKG